MRLSAADCLRRGWTNLSANWELVLIQWLQSFLVTALLALGVVLPLLIVGANLSAGPGAARQAEEVARRLAHLGPSLLLALAAMAAVWTLSLLLHCYFLAGTFGILTAADRQALPGSRRRREFFRAFSLRDFLGWGALYVWRFLRLSVLFWGVVVLLGAAVALWLGFTAAGGGRWGSPAALGIGCGGALPLGFLALTVALWLGVAQAALAREGSGVRDASRRGLAVLGRRLGAVIVLFLLVALAAIGLAMVFFPLAAATDGLLAGAPLAARALVRCLLLLVQSLPNTLLAMVLAGSLVALVRSETPSEFRRNPEVQPA
ncbi:MAG TPA: hypothetical protein VGH73_26280 [Thermoanaerobaculia bacterium]|jgi:hypothetical protein